MTQSLRLLPLEAADGPTNMAADELLLETAAQTGLAAFRVYTWKAPTVSLGYFQPAADREKLPGLATLPWVRRATGGAAIVHHREATYALALPADKEYHAPDESWLCRMHRLIRGVLAGHGVASAGVVCGAEKKLGDVLCFLHQTPADVTVAGSKVVGSAQRKHKGALLQHGSILLSRSEHAEVLAGINEFAGREVLTVEQLRAELLLALREDTGWEFVEQPWTPTERVEVERIRTEKYAADEWNKKR